jgi:hypothetical protein
MNRRARHDETDQDRELSNYYVNSYKPNESMLGLRACEIYIFSRSVECDTMSCIQRGFLSLVCIASSTNCYRLQASGMGLFYIRVNVKALVTGSITKWSPNSGPLHGTIRIKICPQYFTCSTSYVRKSLPGHYPTKISHPLPSLSRGYQPVCKLS